MTNPVPTRSDLQKFVETEGWTQVRNARGRKGSHHLTYELHLPDGRTLRTRISHPPDRTDIGTSLFAHVLRDQLDVGEDEFWACVKDGTKPDRGAPKQDEGEALPTDVAYQLETKVGMSKNEIAALGKAGAIARLTEFWTTGK